MSAPSPKPITYAPVAWSPEDIQDLRPSWSLNDCATFLEENASHIQEATIRAGWEAIDALLPPEELPPSRDNDQ